MALTTQDLMAIRDIVDDSTEATRNDVHDIYLMLKDKQDKSHAKKQYNELQSSILVNKQDAERQFGELRGMIVQILEHLKIAT